MIGIIVLVVVLSFVLSVMLMYRPNRSGSTMQRQKREQRELRERVWLAEHPREPPAQASQMPAPSAPVRQQQPPVHVRVDVHIDQPGSEI